ncbi:MAG: tail fiber domain-containing protein [Bacteroidales bacterium]|nr:tail fiber domain-containing protein [Bacteroidales bacterium]
MKIRSTFNKILISSISLFLINTLVKVNAQGVIITNDPNPPVPSALLQTFGLGTGEGNVLFMGEWKGAPGLAPVSGPGTRMMWYPDKAAFRAGRVTGTQWDSENIGYYSTAIGFNNTAFGWFSNAWGSVTTASGSQSTAWGFNSIASGTSATAWGENTRAPSFAETAFGYNNTSYIPVSATEWVASDRLFVIGNGISGSSDALVMLKNGNTGLGVSEPAYRLQADGSIYATTSWWAIRGVKTGTTGTFPGVWGETESASANATGIRGFALNTSSGAGSAGVYGKNFSTTNANYGVFGESVSIFGRGVYGLASATSGTNYGVYGRSISPDGVGVYGQNLSSSGAGGQFVGTNLGLKVSATGDNSEDAIAFLAESKGTTLSYYRIGGYFDVNNEGNYHYAVYAIAQGSFGYGGYFSSPGWAASFYGDVKISGTLYGGSDKRLYRNMNKIDNSLEKINRLQAYSYDYKSDEYVFMNLSKGRQFGFIAQEVEQIFPELVKDMHDPGSNQIEEQKGNHYEAVDYKGINYIGLIPVLTEAIKEQQQIINAQHEMINDLMSRVSKIEQQNN